MRADGRTNGQTDRHDEATRADGRTNGQTARHDEADSRFSQFYKFA